MHAGKNDRLVALFTNSRAGKGKSKNITATIEDFLKRQNIPFITYDRNWPEEMGHCTEAFIVGGDGTLNYFINRYPSTSLPLTLFRGGSGNDFHFKLYGKISLQQNLSIALSGRTERIDAGSCNGKLFMNGFGMGFDGRIVKSMERRSKLSAGYLAYLAVVLQHLLFYKETACTITINGSSRYGRFFMVTVANGCRYGGGFMVAPNALIDDGLFDVLTIKKIHPLLRLFHLPRLKKGSHTGLKFVESDLADSVLIESMLDVPAHLDGEYISGTRFELRMHRGKFLFRY